MDFSDYRFYKFRYTYAEGQTQQEYPGLTVLFGDKFDFELDDPGYYATLGYEELDKYNKPTHPHMHIHFALRFANENTLGSIRKRLQRYFKAKGENRKGNVLYSLAEESDVLDVERFLRYVWKQGGRVARDERIPEGMHVDNSIMLAREEQARMWEFNIAKREKADAPNTRDKLFEWLGKLHEEVPFRCEKDILVKIMEYYDRNDQSANRATLMGFLQSACWKYGLETYSDTADRWLRER